MKKKDVGHTVEKSTVAKDVDEYLINVPEDDRETLEDLRKTIKEAAPMAEEIISYRIPTYKFHGPLVHFVARKNYLSFIVVDKSLIERFKDELEGYKTSGTTIHFSSENPLPEELVKKIVEARIETNELNSKKNKK